MAQQKKGGTKKKGGSGGGGGKKSGGKSKAALQRKKEEEEELLRLLDLSEEKRVTRAIEVDLNDYDEIDTYPIFEPFIYVKVLVNKKNFNRLYYVIEPTVSIEEEYAIFMIKEAMIKALNIRIEDLEGNYEAYLREAMVEIIDAYALPVLSEAEERIFYFIKRDLLGYGPIDPLIHDGQIEDVSCDGPNMNIYIFHRDYESIETNLRWNAHSTLDSYIIRLAQRCGKHISVATPLLDATLMDGSRVVMTLGTDISTHGSTFTIRKFKEDPYTPSHLINFKTFSSLMMAYMWLAVQYGMSLLFVGGTASGKTTTLNALTLYIPRDAKVVSIEETREVNLPHPNWIPGLTREGFGGEKSSAGVKGIGEVDMYDLLKAALRQRPDFIIVGEIRGPEAYVLFQAMATGHTTYSTVHADSVPSLIHRLENKPIDIPRVMLPSLDAVSIQIQSRVGDQRVRRCKQIVEIIGLDPHSGELLTNEAFRWSASTDTFEFYGKSYVLENVMLLTNMSKSEITKELKDRQTILEWMVENDVFDYKDVATIVNYYYRKSEIVMALTSGEINKDMFFKGEIPTNYIAGQAVVNTNQGEQRAQAPPMVAEPSAEDLWGSGEEGG